MSSAASPNRDAHRSDREALVDDLPEDVLTVLVRTLASQPRRPQALLALTSTCKELRALLPPTVRIDAARDTVDHTLGARPSLGELQALGILPVGAHTSARLAAAQQALQREMTRAAVVSRLTSRPDPSELLQRGVLKHSYASAMSPSLAQAAEQLEHAMRRDQLTHSLERRPSPAELRAHGIVRTPAALSSRLAEAADRLERRRRRDSLSAHLEIGRLSLEENSPPRALRRAASWTAASQA
ncbi:hypothetical protein EMIHUDRAFT_443832 [Emiliania huxleyi CCMP1516]|uniref:F-box domain-containing protein n=2 Tax=Emiliania huxleyi TaxID=2903 RepID=A0A0D3JLV8_EMIH1|nr:hypothetical protein EMIHUDRAFT_438593 [Emiliania huxleyi CCMP1516]XP_005776922.1 hypothetical protein EMIHUDRAFT_443832 [Emiliania huxleyi CCMP1516]EOD07559.1 hypothetical protein EMIHUDRAFT_438593 [Emiliania huxleyi CCMP1516]EOD24493.1 hypothetical protein EMIHUDRAFT_443832 [Emiliania huxleyi CCMP1516]|eukprot:XP_005759988.1 hypothetical protein EMIHUDRAFT_438593 [Emiliania huxleyi CCMP1516]